MSARRRTFDPPPEIRQRFASLVEQLGGREAAARRMGCSRSCVATITDGSRRPGIRTAYAIEVLSDGRIAMEDWLPNPDDLANRPAEGTA